MVSNHECRKIIRILDWMRVFGLEKKQVCKDDGEGESSFILINQKGIDPISLDALAKGKIATCSGIYCFFKRTLSLFDEPSDETWSDWPLLAVDIA